MKTFSLKPAGTKNPRTVGHLTGTRSKRDGARKHPGWRVKEMKIPTPPEGQDEFVLQPAEVELP